MISQVSYQVIGENKNRPRLWIEGVKLSAAGFIRGARYDVQIQDGQMTLELNPEGARKVSGKLRGTREIPILDLALKDLEEHFGSGTRVRVLFTKDVIRVSLHHEEQARIDRENRLEKGLATGALTEASMFTGGGISTHAIHTAIKDYGATSRLAWVVDAELKYLQSAYANNYAITDDTLALVGRAEEIETQFFRKVDILSFSMPCSGFSTAGKSKHRKSPEAHDGAAALFGTLSAIRAANPAILISENVVEARDSAAYVLLKAEITRLGYVIHERIMDARDTATIENRRRYWFIALSRGIAEGFDFSAMHVATTHSPRTIAEILDAEVPETAWNDHTYLKEKALRDAEAGKGFVRQLLDGSEAHCGTIGRFYSKRRSTEPFIARADGKERLLSLNEHARAKSIPETLVQGLSSTVGHEILGQSIDWRQAWLAMASVMAHLTRRMHPDMRVPTHLSEPA